MAPKQDNASFFQILLSQYRNKDSSDSGQSGVKNLAFCRWHYKNRHL